MLDLLQEWGLCLLILLLPSITPPPPILSRPSQECVRKVDFLDLTKNHEFPFKDQIIASSYFQWSMQDLECLVNITNFEFLCRKLNFVHVGIVQNFIFFIKSARRFRKTISTLASHRLVWSLEYQDQWQCTFEFESYEWCGEKFTVGKPGA